MNNNSEKSFEFCPLGPLSLSLPVDTNYFIITKPIISGQYINPKMKFSYWKCANVWLWCITTSDIFGYGVEKTERYSLMILHVITSEVIAR